MLLCFWVTLQIVGDLTLCYSAFASTCDFAFILFYNFYKLYLYICIFDYLIIFYLILLLGNG